MSHPSYLPEEDIVRLAEKVVEVLNKLPPAIAAGVRRDTERMLRDAHADRRQSWKRRPRRYGRRWVGPAI